MLSPNKHWIYLTSVGELADQYRRRFSLRRRAGHNRSPAKFLFAFIVRLNCRNDQLLPHGSRFRFHLDTRKRRARVTSSVPPSIG